MQDVFRPSHHEYIQIGGDVDDSRDYQSLLGSHSPHHLGGPAYVDAVDDMNDKYPDDDGGLLHHQHHHGHHADVTKDVDLGAVSSTAASTTTTIGGFNVINRPTGSAATGAALGAAGKDQGMVKVETDMQGFNLLPPFMSD